MAKKPRKKLTDKKIEFYIKDELEAYEDYMAVYNLDKKKYKYFKVMALEELRHYKYLKRILKKRKKERKND